MNLQKDLDDTRRDEVLSDIQKELRKYEDSARYLYATSGVFKSLDPGPH